VGEAPAVNEIRAGEPFVGASGKLLNVVLKNYGVDREDVLLTNAALCHYPKSMKKMPPAAIAACRPRLISELAQAQTETAVLMGASAMQGVLGTAGARQGVNKLRAGPPKKVSLDFENEVEKTYGVLELNVVPTFHPAACLRNQGQFPLMLSDVGKATSHTRSQGWYEPDVFVIDDEDEAAREITDLIRLNKDYGVVVDTESGLDKDDSFGRNDGIFGNVLCIGVGSLAPGHENYVTVFSKHALTPHVKVLMKELFNTCGTVMHNGKYDVGVLMNFLDQDEPFPLNDDTLLASYVINEIGGIHGLKYLGKEFLGCPEWDAEIKPFITKEEGYGSIPPDLLHKYNAYDVHVTRILRTYMLARVEQEDVEPLYRFLLKLSPMLTKVERNGIGFDVPASKELEAKLNVELERLEAELPINPRSPKQIKEYALDFDWPMESTDADHLTVLIDNEKAPDQLKWLAGKILESRKHTKMNSNYVAGLQKKLLAPLQPHWRPTVHTTFLIHGTTTGRLSSRGPNLQNVPRAKEIKKQFIPQNPKNVLLQVDFSQAELRVLTWLAKEEGMRELFNDPSRDVFTELCRHMFSNFDRLSPEEQKELRTLIKTFAYGISYGRTAAGIAADPAFNMSVAEADRQMKLFQRQIPAIIAFQQEVIRKIHDGEDLINPFGRHRRFYLITDQNRSSVENEAMAYLPQSTASDICLKAACQLSGEGVQIRNLIHDAILVETHPDNAQALAVRMNEVMCAVADEITGGYVDFATDAKFGNTWADV
jgi:uracil-DNA glycosylase family 4